MSPTEPVVRSVSDTAMWVAAIRAEESDRSDAMFRDPFARRLAGERGFEILRTIRQPAIRQAVALRTVVIDEVVAASVSRRRCDTVLSLAAGLDARPWRMALPDGLRWIDVDLPQVLERKSSILEAEHPACAYEAVSVDLADEEARRSLFARVGSTSARTAVLSEGLLGYLEPDAVAALAKGLYAEATFAEWVVDLAGPQVVSGIRNAGSEHRSEDAQTRFAPDENTGFFAPYGWDEAEYIDLFLDSHRFGRETLSHRVLRGIHPMLPAKTRTFLERGLGIVRFERGEAAA